MNSEDFPDLHSSERFIDAALAEKARLGNNMDDELVHRVFQETVNRTPAAPAERLPAWDTRLAVTVAISVAAVVSLCVLVLSQFTWSDHGRPANEFFFVVTIAEPSNPSFHAATEPENPIQIAAVPHDASVEVAPPSFQIDLAENDTGKEDSVSVAPQAESFNAVPASDFRHDRFSVAAESSEKRSGQMVFAGNVLISHSEFRIEADTATVPVQESSGTVESSLLILARSVTVEDRRSGRIVKADLLEFNPSTGVVELRGIDSFDGPEFANHTWLPGDRLALSRGNPTLITAETEVYAAPHLRTRP